MLKAQERFQGYGNVIQFFFLHQNSILVVYKQRITLITLIALFILPWCMDMF